MYKRQLAYVQEKQLLLDRQQDRLRSALERDVAKQRANFTALCAALDSLSPLKVLSRGYALAQTPDGKVITGVEQTAVGDRIELTLSDGRLGCTVTERMQTNGSKEEKL